MSLSSDARARLVVALASPGFGKEVADAIDNALGGNPSGNLAFTGNNTHTGKEDFKRVFADQGTPLVAGDWALSGGFGTTASVAVTAGSKDTKFQITVTSSGSGQGANPTATLTFKDGTYTNAPVAVVCRGGGSQNTVPLFCTTTATTLVITFEGTPSAAETYVINGIVLG